VIGVEWYPAILGQVNELIKRSSLIMPILSKKLILLAALSLCVHGFGASDHSTLHAQGNQESTKSSTKPTTPKDSKTSTPAKSTDATTGSRAKKPQPATATTGAPADTADNQVTASNGDTVSVVRTAEEAFAAKLLKQYISVPKPDASKPITPKPGESKGDAAKVDAGKPKEVNSESKKAAPTQPESKPTEATKPEATKTDAGKTETIQPEATKPTDTNEATKPEASKNTDAVQSDATSADTIKAATGKSETAEPEVAKAVPSNLVIAPYGVYEVLAMLRSSAGGTTRTALEQLLGTDIDEAQLAKALSTLRSVGNPYVLQLGAPVSDNEGYGVKLLAAPAPESSLAQADITEGDLIFSVDGVPVRKAADLMKECAASTGQIRLNGFDFSTGETFADKSVELTRTRQLAAAPDRQMLNVANAFLADERLKVDSKFTNHLEALYKAPTFTGDFSKFSSLEVPASAFFNDATAGRMSRIKLPKESSPDAVFMLVNVLAMEAQWQRRFPPATAGTFHAPSGDVPAQMMGQKSGYRLAEFQGLQVLELPYRDSSLVMWILLPTEKNGWQTFDLAQMLTPKSMSQIRGAMKMGMVDVQLPKFKITRDESLKSVLSTMGLTELFTKKANLEHLTAANDVTLEDVRQQVFIEVNEQGTRAGAVTQAIGAVKSLPPQNLKRFHADHPFVFVVRDESGGVYFAGRVISPEAAATAVPAAASTK